MTRTREAREALDRSSRIVLDIPIPTKEDDPALAEAIRSEFYATMRLVRLVRQNPHLLRVAEEVVEAYERDHAACAKPARNALLRIRELERKLEEAFPDLRPSTPPTKNSENWSNSLARFDEVIDRLLASPQSDCLSRNDTDTLRDILNERLAACAPTGVDQAIEAMKGTLLEIRQELRQAQRGQRLLQRSHPGAFWKWLVGKIDEALLTARLQEKLARGTKKTPGRPAKD